MGEIDMVLNRYFEDGERYADLINGYAFNGDQVVRKEDVQELDPRETGVAGRLGRIRSTMPCRCGPCCRTRRSMTASCAEYEG